MVIKRSFNKNLLRSSAKIFLINIREVHVGLSTSGTHFMGDSGLSNLCREAVFSKVYRKIDRPSGQLGEIRYVRVRSMESLAESEDQSQNPSSEANGSCPLGKRGQ